MILGIHLAYIAWVIFGAMLTRGRPWLRSLHIATLAWSVVVEIGPWPCPLTVAENWLEVRAGVPAFRGGFIQHYFDKVIYPNVPPRLLTLAALLVVASNLAIYIWRYCNRRTDRSW